MIEIAKKTSPNTCFYLGNFVDFSFDKKFDGIYTQAFMHLFPKKLEDLYSKIKGIKKIHESPLVDPFGKLWINVMLGFEN